MGEKIGMLVHLVSTHHGKIRENAHIETGKKKKRSGKQKREKRNTKRHRSDAKTKKKNDGTDRGQNHRGLQQKREGGKAG